MSNEKAKTRVKTRRELLDLRDQRICERFNELFAKKRIRYDDVMEILEDEFYLTTLTISRILKKSDKKEG